MRKIVLFLVTLTILGCQRKTDKIYFHSFVDTTKESSGSDVRLSIVNSVKSSDGTLYTLKSFYNKDTLGFQILLPNKLSEDGSGNGFEIITLGKISKNFRNSLAAVYKLKIDTSVEFVNKLILSYVNVSEFATKITGQKPSDDDGFTDYKLFFEDSKNSDEGEAEIFLNINENDKIVQLREKDPDYRKALIGFFTQKTTK